MEWNSLDNQVQADNHQTRLNFPKEQIMEKSVMVKSSEQGALSFSKEEETMKLSYQTTCEA
jgi:hypothetical protein